MILPQGNGHLKKNDKHSQLHWLQECKCTITLSSKNVVLPKWVNSYKQKWQKNEKGNNSTVTVIWDDTND